MSAADRSAPRAGWRPDRRWIVAAAVAAIVLGLATAFATGVLVSGSAHGPSGSGAVALLPSPGSASRCIVGTPGVPRPTLALRYAVLQGNTYDVPNGTVGHVGMCYRSAAGSMFAYANWSAVGSAGGWFSYPQITYGVNAWDGALSTYTNQSPSWSLPQTVASIVGENVWFTASYRLDPPPAANVTGYDLSLDDFFTETLPPEFEAGPFVEIEIFLAHNISYPFTWASWPAPTLVNGTLAVVPWDVAYWCHGVDNGTNANISFDFSLGGQATDGLPNATVGVNLSAVLAEVEELAPGATCWTGPTDDFGSFHLDEANLGSEDGAVGGAAFSYNWTVSTYCIHPGVRDPTADDLGCGSAGLPATGAAGPGSAPSDPTEARPREPS